MRVAYLSYDGALDPLGATQVVPYLESLARKGVSFELITFEKPSRIQELDRVSGMSKRLALAGIKWHPLQYHHRPRVPATLFDVALGAMCLRRLAHRSSIDLFHCRGEVAPLMVRLSGLAGPLLLDMRGFFADERIDAGSWVAGGILDRVVRAQEHSNLMRATRIVVLTERGREVLRSRGVQLPIDVIPTCVDCSTFRRMGDVIDFDLVYFGSLGGWYMTDEMLAFANEIRRSGEVVRVLFLTNNPEDATTRRLRDAGLVVQRAAPEEVPGWLSRCKAAFFFIRATDSKIASCPTKLAEALAMGLPILTGPGVGDVDVILREEGVGIVLDDFSSSSFRRGWEGLKGLVNNPQTAARCRAVAENRLSLETAVSRYQQAYEALTNGPVGKP